MRGNIQRRIVNSLGACTLAVMAGAAPTLCARVAADGSIDIAAWVARWPTHFSVAGGKSEPTYVEAVNIERQGDVFSTLAGAPVWELRSTEALSVGPDGTVARVVCPKGMNCARTTPSVSFLSSAWLLAAYRAHRPLGRATPVSYGDREVVCLPAERIGIAEAVLDPCFDLETGAVLAQRHRLSGRFDGPSLDPGSIRIGSGPKS
jgi:hypothetical protein